MHFLYDLQQKTVINSSFQTQVLEAANWRRSWQKIMYIKAIIFVLFSLFLWLPVADGLTKHFKSNTSFLFTLVAYLFVFPPEWQHFVTVRDCVVPSLFSITKVFHIQIIS